MIFNFTRLVNKAYKYEAFEIIKIYISSFSRLKENGL